MQRKYVWQVCACVWSILESDMWHNKQLTATWEEFICNHLLHFLSLFASRSIGVLLPCSDLWHSRCVVQGEGRTMFFTMTLNMCVCVCMHMPTDGLTIGGHNRCQPSLSLLLNLNTRTHERTHRQYSILYEADPQHTRTITASLQRTFPIGLSHTDTPASISP